jgi:hypothetical protein
MSCSLIHEAHLQMEELYMLSTCLNVVKFDS